MNSEIIPCIICGSSVHKTLFAKPFSNGQIFTVVKCTQCGLEFVNPRPLYNSMHIYYDTYFTHRTDRGYNDYFSDKQKSEVIRLLTLNLKDLGFYSFESSLGGIKNALDIGCAAGYFVEFLTNRGWMAEGIDIARDCIVFATEQLHLNAYCDDFLDHTFTRTYDLITMWATIEHLHYPNKFIEKIHQLLKPHGLLYISTCRSSIFSARIIFQQHWRYYNLPHHLYFFSYRLLAKLLQQKGFRVIRFSTYGSGVGKPGSLTRTVADTLAKKLYLGDMMCIAAQKS